MEIFAAPAMRGFAALACIMIEEIYMNTTNVVDLAQAIQEFEAALPGWWWSVYVCHLTRDASCGPDVAGTDCKLLECREFDNGFHCDDAEGTLASSLRDVMRQALGAKARFLQGEQL